MGVGRLQKSEEQLPPDYSKKHRRVDLLIQHNDIHYHWFKPIAMDIILDKNKIFTPKKDFRIPDFPLK
jgi:hypothetical protein